MWIAIGAAVLIALILLAIGIRKRKDKEIADTKKKKVKVKTVKAPRRYIGGVQYIAPSNKPTGKSFIRIAQGSEPTQGTISIGDTIILEAAGIYTGTYKVNEVWIKDGKDSGIYILEKETVTKVRPGGKIYLDTGRIAVIPDQTRG